MKSIYRYIWLMALIPHLALATDSTSNPTVDNLNFVGGEAGLRNSDIRKVIINVIKVVLGFVGILFFLLILWSGFEWMTSGGNEKKLGDAKNRIVASTIGLVIILMSYAIAASISNWLATAVSTAK